MGVVVCLGKEDIGSGVWCGLSGQCTAWHTLKTGAEAFRELHRRSRNSLKRHCRRRPIVRTAGSLHGILC